MQDVREYGGYFSLDLLYRGEYFKEDKNYIQRYNLGRSAICQAIIDSEAMRVWLPVYLCSVVGDFLKRKGIEFIPYNIDADFMPINIDACEKDIVVWTSYFGVMNTKNHQDIFNKYRRVIFDNTQAFYAPPIKRAYNVYSCRKFFGVSDGSYLVSSFPLKEPKELRVSKTENTISYLWKGVYTSTDACYKLYLENEERLNNEGIMSMSLITRKILGSIDYDIVAQKRERNFRIMDKYLQKFNLLHLTKVENPPMIYPLLIKIEGLRERLVQKKIYVPHWWKVVEENDKASEWEIFLSKYLIPLPIDQRYTEDDILQIKEIVMGEIENK